MGWGGVGWGGVYVCVFMMGRRWWLCGVFLSWTGVCVCVYSRWGRVHRTVDTHAHTHTHTHTHTWLVHERDRRVVRLLLRRDDSENGLVLTLVRTHTTFSLFGGVGACVRLCARACVRPGVDVCLGVDVCV